MNPILRQPLSRRTFLRGIGATLALPTLEAMIPAARAATRPGFTADGHPLRMAFVYHPNGVIMSDWVPGQVGALDKLPATLQSLDGLKDEFQVLSGLGHTRANANGDGGGDHARANATFLTGQQARKTAGADIRVGISVDQVAAEKIGNETYLPSLELSCDGSRQAGSCDSGYSCAYQFNMAWKSESTPMPPESNPRMVFERLFSGGSDKESAESLEKRRIYGKSILDYVMEDARRLRGSLGYTDRRKIDEYMESVRDVERRIEKAENTNPEELGFQVPKGTPKSYIQHIRMMYDLMALSFQTDVTRISTFLVAHDGSNRTYPEIKVNEGHHTLSHHRDDEVKIRKIAAIDRFHVAQFAYFLNRLKSIREGEASLLDRCMIVYGGGISDGNRHRHTNLPVLLAGRGGGTLQPGRHVLYENGQPMTNLYLSMLDRLGAPVQRIGDSTGPLGNI